MKVLYLVLNIKFKYNSSFTLIVAYVTIWLVKKKTGQKCVVQRYASISYEREKKKLIRWIGLTIDEIGFPF